MKKKLLSCAALMAACLAVSMPIGAKENPEPWSNTLSQSEEHVIKETGIDKRFDIGKTVSVKLDSAYKGHKGSTDRKFTLQKGWETDSCTIPLSQCYHNQKIGRAYRISGYAAISGKQRLLIPAWSAAMYRNKPYGYNGGYDGCDLYGSSGGRIIKKLSDAYRSSSESFLFYL